MRIFCAECKKETNHEVLKEVFEKSNNEDVFGDDTWQIVRCKGCDTTSFRHGWHFSEDFGPSGLLDQEELFPKRSKDLLVKRSILQTPRKIRWIYHEVIDAFNNETNRLCAGGLRAIIEGICNLKKISSGPVEIIKKGGEIKIERRKNLEGKIAGMMEKGLITKQQADDLHELRFLGNEALHELEEPSDVELKCAIKIVENMIDNQYEIPKLSSELKELKQDRELI